MKKIGVITGRDAIKQNYYAAVTAAKGEVIPFDPYTKGQDIKNLIRGIDGILLSGGVDLQPFYYHEENTHCGELDSDLDEFEMAVVKEAVAQEKPILGICRGLQLLNVFFGGSLYQDIFCACNHKRTENDDNIHETTVDKNSFIYDVYGKEKIFVNSAHHQAIKELGKDIVPVQYSKEKIVEAFYHRTKPVFAVQWHPERMCLDNARTDTEDGLKIFEYFISSI